MRSLESRGRGTHFVGTVGVDAVDQVPVLVLHVLEANIPQDSGVVE